tara:strand:- start:9 stop:479 length:471 start_codon:yes stop_codon:yes gene_type:complete
MINKIRPSTREDIDLIIEFIKKLAKYEKMQDKVFLEKRNLEKYLFGDKPFAEVLVIEHDSLAVGFALFFHNFSTFEGRPGLYLEDLFILPEFRGNGLGKLTLQKLAEIARERNCARFEWVCLDWNTPSIEFYVKQGAKPKKEWIIFRMDGEQLQNY